MERTARRREQRRPRGSARRSERKGAERRSASRPLEAEEAGFALARRGRLLLIASLLAIILGFIALALRSMVLAPLLLILGYLVGVPWALSSGGTAKPTEEISTGADSSDG